MSKQKKAFDEMFNNVENAKNSSIFESQFKGKKKKLTEKEEYEKNRVIDTLSKNVPSLRQAAQGGKVTSDKKVIISPVGIFSTLFTKIEGKDSPNKGKKSSCNGLQKSKNKGGK